MDLRRGDTFTHRRWLDADRNSLACRITAVRRGVVYWRPVTGGHPYMFHLADAAKYVTQGTLCRGGTTL